MHAPCPLETACCGVQAVAALHKSCDSFNKASEASPDAAPSLMSDDWRPYQNIEATTRRSSAPHLMLSAEPK